MAAPQSVPRTSLLGDFLRQFEEPIQGLAQHPRVWQPHKPARLSRPPAPSGVRGLSESFGLCLYHPPVVRSATTRETSEEERNVSEHSNAVQNVTFSSNGDDAYGYLALPASGTGRG